LAGGGRDMSENAIWKAINIYKGSITSHGCISFVFSSCSLVLNSRRLRCLCDGSWWEIACRRSVGLSKRQRIRSTCQVSFKFPFNVYFAVSQSLEYCLLSFCICETCFVLCLY
jgi:hypothetical protein